MEKEKLTFKSVQNALEKIIQQEDLVAHQKQKIANAISELRGYSFSYGIIIAIWLAAFIFVYSLWLQYFGVESGRCLCVSDSTKNALYYVFQPNWHLWKSLSFMEILSSIIFYIGPIFLSSMIDRRFRKWLKRALLNFFFDVLHDPNDMTLRRDYIERFAYE